jgi:hypothetical protein
MNKIHIVGEGPAEPNEEELKKKQAEILERLRSVTPDQLKEFRGKSLKAGLTGDVKEAWNKTIWAK